MKLTVTDVSYRLGKKQILKEIGLTAASGKFVGVIGPNGSGKSTLLKTIYRMLTPDVGTISLGEEMIGKLSSRQIAQRMAVVSQETSALFDFSVGEIVMMGRTPHKGLLQSDSREDHELVDEALLRVGLAAYKERSFHSLSGGEKQRVFIARALAQQANVIVLDEPTNHLDIRYQLQIMELVKTLDITVLAALHDLNLAAQYCDYLYVMQAGNVVASGAPEHVLTSELLLEVFAVNTQIRKHPVTQKPYIFFLSALPATTNV